ncbi:MAG: hypothetical protein IPJ19_16185 [Planctomycetes bacterium]|nr:hypothetical protein [Planctomycetota bacterium]
MSDLWQRPCVWAIWIRGARSSLRSSIGGPKGVQTEFEHALEGLLPDHARAALEKLRDECKERQGLGPKR